MAKSKSRRPARRKGKSTKKSNRKHAKVVAKSRKTKRGKSATRKTKRALAQKHQCTTAEGMRRALKLKLAAEEREHESHPQPVHNWTPEIPQQHKPDPVPNNLQEQGDLANILQNTNHRRAG